MINIRASYLISMLEYMKKGNILAADIAKLRLYLAILILTIMMAVLLPACRSSIPATPLERVTLQLKWLHQAQFVGFYMAQENGYYEQEGLEVLFLEGGPEIDISKEVITGRADFAVTSPEELLINRSRSDPLTAIAAVYRHSAVLFLSKAGSEIVRPQDFAGKTVSASAPVGASDFEIQFLSLMKQLQIDVSGIQVVPYDASYAGFIRGDVDITPAYFTGGLIKLRQQGLDLNLIWPSDYGIHFYSDILATSESMVADNPELTTRFLRASLRGWQDAISHYEQAASVTLKYAGSTDLEVQTAMMEAMLPLVNTGEDSIGWMKANVWRDMYHILEEQDLLARQYDVEKAYSLNFLEQVMRSDQE